MAVTLRYLTATRALHSLGAFCLLFKYSNKKDRKVLTLVSILLYLVRGWAGTKIKDENKNECARSDSGWSFFEFPLKQPKTLLDPQRTEQK